MGKKQTANSICMNRRARFDYAVEQTFEAGISLLGGEVKSIRNGRVSINEAYASFVGNELWLINAHIAPYENAGYIKIEERRTRKLLMNRKELDRLQQATQAKGYTLVPLGMHWKRGNVKVVVGLAKGKKTVDKRQTIKERDWNRQKQRMFKGG